MTCQQLQHPNDMPTISFIPGILIEELWSCGVEMSQFPMVAEQRNCRALVLLDD